MRVFLVTSHEAVGKTLTDIIRGYGHDCHLVPLTPPAQAAQRLAQCHADMLVVGLSPQPEPGLAFLREQRPTTVQRVLAVGPVSDPKLRLAALRDGADQYVDEAELRLEMEAIFRRLSTRAAAPAAPTLSGRVISVLSPSGGSGSSTLAANLAAALAKEHKACALIDLNLGAGDVASLLDLKPTHTLADICRHGSGLDRTLFERSLVRHECGVALLAPARSFADIGQVTTQGVREMLVLARGMFPYVVVDLDDSFHSEQTQTLRVSDVILLVLRLDFTSLRNTRKTLDHLAQLNINRQRVRLVVNRYGQPQELPSAKAEEALGVKISHYVPDDPRTINRSNNNGVPAVLDAPTAKVSKSVFQLAAGVNGQPK
jgi:pilus assembly protein CpaE